MTVTIFCFAFALGTASVARAAKPTVHISEMIQRATHIVAGRVVSAIVISPGKKAPSGEWLPEKRLVRVETDRVLKKDDVTQVPKVFEFDTEALVFDKGESYILFLAVSIGAGVENKKDADLPVQFEHLGSPARRIEATAATIEEVQHELKKTKKTNKVPEDTARKLANPQH